MARLRFNDPIEAMDLANMRANGVRSLLIWCRNCHHEKIMNVDHLPGDLTVPSLGQRMSCIVRHCRSRRAAELVGAAGA